MHQGEGLFQLSSRCQPPFPIFGSPAANVHIFRSPVTKSLSPGLQGDIPQISLSFSNNNHQRKQSQPGSQETRFKSGPSQLTVILGSNLTSLYPFSPMVIRGWVRLDFYISSSAKPSTGKKNFFLIVCFPVLIAFDPYKKPVIHKPNGILTLQVRKCEQRLTTLPR